MFRRCFGVARRDATSPREALPARQSPARAYARPLRHNGALVMGLFQRRIVKLLLRPVVTALGIPAAAAIEVVLRFTSRRVGIALMYHSVAVVQGDQTREIVAPHGVSTLERQLRHLQRRYRVVEARDLLEATRARRRGEPFPVAVTFDDDLSSHAKLALPVLVRVGTHATFFLSGASLAAPFAFWWERLQRASDRGLDDLPALVGVPGATVRELGYSIEEMTPVEREAVSARLAERLGPDPPDAGMREQDVEELVRAGMTVGFHTLRHDQLPPLSDDALAAALRDGRERLEHVVGRPLDVIGYPHGHADARVAAAARAAGFTTGFGVADTVVWADSDPLLLGRITPTYRSAGHFAIQLALQLLTRQR
jgi:peptidoglycan/xylan/chitin deacetylase (PgdA/CDA1 family)